MTEYALYKQFSCKEVNQSDHANSLSAKPDDFEVGLVVIHDRIGGQIGSTDQTTLKLRFYVILTSKKDLFPEKNPEHKKRVLIVRKYSASKFNSCLLLLLRSLGEREVGEFLFCDYHFQIKLVYYV